MDQPLFRPEVVEARRTGWLGSISLAQPLRLWVLATVAAGAAIAIGVFLASASYTRRARVPGQLVPDLGLSTVVASSAGVVARIYPADGARVLAGMPLVLVATPRTTHSGADARASVDEGIDRRRQSLRTGARSQAAQLDTREAGLRAQLLAMEGEAARIRDQLTSRGQQVALGRDTLERYEILQHQHYVSALQLSQQRQAVLDLLAARQALQRQLAALGRERLQVQQGLDELPAQRATLRATTARDLALLDREQVQNDASGELLIEAPVAGLVANRLVEPGQSVQAGQPLLSLLPAGSHLQAQLFVPSRAAGFIATGDHVLLRYQAFPYQKFGHHEGVVSRVSRSAMAGGAGDAGSRGGEPYYRVLVDIDRQSVTAYGRQEPLRPGMLLEADILGERRKLYEWVLEPLYSITGRL
jgi:membrane fusion protein